MRLLFAYKNIIYIYDIQVVINLHTHIHSKECVRVPLGVILCKMRTFRAYHLKELAYTAHHLKYVNDA